jgi:hypothetical protein
MGTAKCCPGRQSWVHTPRIGAVPRGPLKGAQDGVLESVELYPEDFSAVHAGLLQLSHATQDWRPGLHSAVPAGLNASTAGERTMQRQKPMVQICATWVSAFAPSAGDIRAWKRKTSNNVLQHMYPNITPRASAATTAQNTVNIPTSFPIMALQICSFGSSPGASCAHSRKVSVSL